jgi:hypothetical protein
MNIFSQIDWESVFMPSLNIGEIILRGSVIYLFLFVLLRILRRGAGTIGISDLLVIVLIADAAQNAMASEYKSITEGIVLVTTIVFWDYFLDWLGYRFPLLRPLVRPAPLLLIKDGHIQRRNLRQEMITEEELIEELREQGVESVEEVKKGENCIEALERGVSIGYASFASCRPEQFAFSTTLRFAATSACLRRPGFSGTNAGGRLCPLKRSLSRRRAEKRQLASATFVAHCIAPKLMGVPWPCVPDRHS